MTKPPRRADTTGARALIVPETWATQGNCTIPANTNPRITEAVWALFDEPTAGDTATARAERLATARRLCHDCPVVLECREFGMEQDFGFYGGLTPEERAARRRGDRRTHEQLMRAARKAERAYQADRRAQAAAEGATA